MSIAYLCRFATDIITNQIAIEVKKKKKRWGGGGGGHDFLSHVYRVFLNMMSLKTNLMVFTRVTSFTSEKKKHRMILGIFTQEMCILFIFFN